jgi:hypothetical protein
MKHGMERCSFYFTLLIHTKKRLQKEVVVLFLDIIFTVSEISTLTCSKPSVVVTRTVQTGWKRDSTVALLIWIGRMPFDALNNIWPSIVSHKNELSQVALATCLERE